MHSVQRWPHPTLSFGSLLLTLFGGWWIAGWADASANTVVVAIVALLCAILAVASIAAVRRSSWRWKRAQDSRVVFRRFGLVNAATWTALGASVFVLNAVGQAQYVWPTVIFVVGVHFLPLASLFTFPPYRYTGGALILIAAYSAAFTVSRPGVAGLLAGIVLWITAIAVLYATNESTAR